MNEPWFRLIVLGILGKVGSSMGLAGMSLGVVVGWGPLKAQKLVYKKLVLGINIFSFTVSFILLIISIIAYLSGQSREIWYGFEQGIRGILDGTMGSLGGLTGMLASIFALRRKAKNLVLGAMIFSIVLSLSLLFIGIIAYLSGQPRRVWFEFGSPGLTGTVMFGTAFAVIILCRFLVSMKEPQTVKPPVAPEVLTQCPAQELPQEDSRSVLLKEIFPELDRILQETLELRKDIQEREMTPENYAECDARGKELEAELQGYCRQIAEEFPAAVTFIPINFQGDEQVYDVNFQVLKDSLDGPVPSELEGYFRYTRLRKMFRRAILLR